MSPEVASLLMRQHNSLMDEGTTAQDETSADIGLLNEAWALVRGTAGFTLHWGFDNGFIDSKEHLGGCHCPAARVWRGELRWCRECQQHVPAAGHECPASAVVWITEQQGRGD